MFIQYLYYKCYNILNNIYTFILKQYLHLTINLKKKKIFNVSIKILVNRIMMYQYTTVILLHNFLFYTFVVISTKKNYK